MTTYARMSMRRTILGAVVALVSLTAVAAPSASGVGSGTITGVVTYGDTGLPVAGVAVTAMTDPNESGQSWGYGAVTDANGVYVVDLGYQNAPSATFSIQVAAPSAPYRAHFPTTPEEHFAYVAGDTIAGKNIALQRFPAVSGSAVDGDGDPVTCGSAALALTDDASEVATSNLRSDGTFWLDTEGIESGRYTVVVRPCASGDSLRVATTWLGRAASMDAASTLYLNQGDVVALAPLVVFDAATIAGSVVAETYECTSYFGFTYTTRAEVQAIESDAPHYILGFSQVADDGTYLIRGLAPGDYSIVFQPAFACGDDAATLERGHWWSGDPSAPAREPDDAERLSLTAGQSVTGVDATLAPGGSRIEGVVLDSDGAPAAGVPVSVTRADGLVVAGNGIVRWPYGTDYGTLFSGANLGPGMFHDASTTTDVDGHFWVDGVEAGTYDVYLGGGAEWLADADPVPAAKFADGAIVPGASAGVTVNGTDDHDLGTVQLGVGGTISGTLHHDSSIVWDPESYTHAVELLAFLFDAALGEWVIAETVTVYELEQGSTYTIRGLAPGTYKVGFFDYVTPGFAPELYGATFDFEQATPVTVGAGAAVTGIDFELSAVGPVAQTRYAGVGRYETSVAMSQTFAPGVDVAYVASGENFPDALAAAPAAADAGGPLLITQSTSLPDVVKAELQRLNPERIVVVGGEAAVNSTVYAELTGLAGSGGISRVSGADRYATARAVVADHWASASVSRVYIASGRNFPDALSAAAAAGAMGVPVITVDGTAADLDPEVADLIESLGATEIAVAGGTGAVSAGILADLSSLSGVESAWRYAGANRYATGAAINHDAFEGSDVVYVASGKNFPDALSGAVLAGRDDAPLYIVPGECIPQAVADDIRDFGATKVRMLGGSAVVSVDLARVAICTS